MNFSKLYLTIIYYFEICFFLLLNLYMFFLNKIFLNIPIGIYIFYNFRHIPISVISVTPHGII